MEEALAGHDNLQRLKSEVVLSLRLVVAVHLLECIIQDAGKLLEVVRLAAEFDEPLVAAFGVGIHKDRGCAIVRNLRSCSGTGTSQSLLGIVHDKLFAKGIDEVLGAAGNNELIGIARGEFYRIANHVAPQASTCTDD